MMNSRLVVLALFGLIGAHIADAVEEQDHLHDHDHEHGDEETHWAGVFELAAGDTYTLSVARNTNLVEEKHMKLVVVPTTTNDHEGLHAAEEKSETLFAVPEASWTDFAVETVATVEATTGSNFEAKLDLFSSESNFRFRVPVSGAYVVSTKHHAGDVASIERTLRDQRGTTHEPGAVEHEESAADVGNSRLGLALGAAALTALPGLLMIAVVGPMVQRAPKWLFAVVDSFAAGAIMACALFLLLPEALQMTNDGQTDVTGTWTWGTAILSGWMLCVLIHHASDIVATAMGQEGGHAHGAAEEPTQEPTQAVESIEVVHEGTQNKEKGHANFAVIIPVLLGDFFHNLVDGMVVAFTAKVCGVSAVWTMVGATLAHEAPQEIADFVILVTRGNLSWGMAALGNSMTALPSALMGAAIAYKIDVSTNFQGVALAFGAGVFLYVGLTELSSAVVQLPKATVKNSLMRFAAFTVGCVCIGLVLLDHTHCEAEGAGGDHSDHGH